MTAEWVIAVVLGIATLLLLGCAAVGARNSLRGRRITAGDRAAAEYQARSRDEAVALIRGAVWLGAMSREDALAAILLAHPELSERNAADLLDRDSQFDAHCDQAGIVDGREGRAR